MCVFGRLRNVEEVAQPVYDATPLEQGAVGMNRPFFYCLIAGKDFVTMNIQSLFSRLCPRWLLRRKDSKNDILCSFTAFFLSISFDIWFMSFNEHPLQIISNYFCQQKLHTYFE